MNLLQKSNNSITPGSVKSQLAITGKSLTEVLMDVNLIVLFDSSGSMGLWDAPGNQSRFDYAKDELVKLQDANPGQILLVEFSSTHVIQPGGVPQYLGGGTNLYDPIKEYGMIGFPVVVVSDGYPDNAQAVLHLVEQNQDAVQISTVYCGPREYGRTPGEDFLEDLANAANGQYMKTQHIGALKAPVQLLLNGGK